MKAAVYHSNSNIEIKEFPKPEISEGEILVKVKASGICGTTPVGLNKLSVSL